MGNFRSRSSMAQIIPINEVRKKRPGEVFLDMETSTSQEITDSVSQVSQSKDNYYFSMTGEKKKPFNTASAQNLLHTNLDLPNLNLNRSIVRKPEEPVIQHINKIVLPKKSISIG